MWRNNWTSYFYRENVSKDKRDRPGSGTGFNYEEIFVFTTDVMYVGKMKWTCIKYSDNLPLIVKTFFFICSENNILMTVLFTFQVPIIILGNKSDLGEDNRVVDPGSAEKWAANERLRLWEVNVHNRNLLLEPIMNLASRLNPQPSKTSFPQLTMGRKNKDWLWSDWEFMNYVIHKIHVLTTCGNCCNSK